MLKSLSVNNYALIHDLNIHFSDGFQVITGQTGAGKSILLNALSLVLGHRADLSSLGDKNYKCVIEAGFDIEAYHLQTLFETLDLDYEPHTIIRREILPSGKSRAFVNDTPVTLNALSELGEHLVDIHSQHQTALLSDSSYLFDIIDTIANTREEKNNYNIAWKKYKEAQIHFNQLTDFQKNTIQEFDYNHFLLQELNTANLQIGKQKDLEDFYEQASHSEEIKDRLQQSIRLLNDDTAGVLSTLSTLKNIFQKTQEFGTVYQQLQDRISSIFIETDDFYQEVLTLFETIDYNPQELENAQQQLQQIYDLQKKHRVYSEQELIEIQKQLEAKVSKMESIEDEINTAQHKVEENRQQALNWALKIREKRLSVLDHFSKQIENTLHLLGMPNAQFKVQLTENQSFNSNGIDQIEFLFMANKGGDFAPVKKVASGGEQSRIMLSIKSILAQYTTLPTLIFDEIDTGVSGEVSQKMGELMQNISHNRQVFAITHIPQVAARGKAHYKVFKQDVDNLTHTQLSLLSVQERIEEIAEMLDGKNPSSSAISHAKELLKHHI